MSSGESRLRRSLWSSSALVATKLVSAGATLAAVPIVVGALGGEAYGLLMTFVAGVALIALLDRGIPGALVGALAEANAKQQSAQARRLVSASWAMLTRSTVWMALPTLAVSIWLSRFFDASAAAAVAALVLTLGALLAIPASLLDAVWRGLQRGYRSSLWQLTSSVAFLLLVWLAALSEAGIAGVAAAFAIAPLLGAALSALDLFARHAPELRPEAPAPEAESRDLRERAKPLWKLQWAGVINNQTDSLVIAALVGLDPVAEYAVTSRLFLPIFGVVALALRPLWPAYAEAAAVRDKRWVDRTLVRSVLASTALSVPVAWVLTRYGGTIIEVWIGPAITPGAELIYAYGVWTLLACLSAPFGFYLLGADLARRPANFAMVGAAANIVLSIVLVPIAGPSGAVWASVLAQSTFLTLPSILLVRRHLRGRL